MILYKYLRPERLDVLLDGRIRYTQPIYFNDPFDAKPVFRAEERRERLESWSRAAAQHWGWTERQRQGMVDLAEASYWKWLYLNPWERPENAKASIEWTVEEFGAAFGILSLAEKPDSVLMWTHYAADHSGFAIGFDTDYPGWNRVGPADDADHDGVLRKVNYSSVRPNWASALDIDRAGFFFTKSIEWEYEQEWRVFRDIDEADHVIRGTQDICLFNFPKASVRQVFLGERASDDLKNRIIQLVEADVEYMSVELVRVRIDSVGFGLRPERILRT